MIFFFSVTSQNNVLPTGISDLANVTLIELDSKLELFSYLQWEIDSFIKIERKNLERQPIEVIDKFIVNEVFSKVDKDIYPVIAKQLTGIYGR